MTTALDPQFIDSDRDEGPGPRDSKMPFQDILDRWELITNQDPRAQHLRRCYSAPDLREIIKFMQLDTADSVDQEWLSDLRRACLEKNLHSLFRVLGSDRAIPELDDLRKVMLEQNLHSLFRVLESGIGDLSGLDDLRKVMIENNVHSFFRYLREGNLDWPNREDLRKFLLFQHRNCGYNLLQSIHTSEIAVALKKLEQEGTEFDLDALSRGQLRSKLWLIEKITEMDLDLGTVFICAGWYSILSALMFESGVRLEKVRSFDIDPDCADIAETFNRRWFQDGWKFKAVTQDILEINYRATEYTVKKSDGTEVLVEDIPDTVINTSCEHIQDFARWWSMIPQGTLIIVQSNDLQDIEDHVNTVDSLEEFQAQTPMDECLYEGELELDHYRRFMRIGYR
jgi:hypothetical protein